MVCLYGDEINLVKPGFNSGWSRVQGIWDSKQVSNQSRESYWEAISPRSKDIMAEDPRSLVTFNGKGNYSQPEFTWGFSVAPTALKFLNSDKLGKEYENDMFVGDFKYGNLYHFDLNRNRTQLNLNGSLAHKVANNEEVPEFYVIWTRVWCNN